MTPLLDRFFVGFQETSHHSLFICWYFISADVCSALGCATVKMGFEVLSLPPLDSCSCQREIPESFTLLGPVL